ncbi:hypothetical protein SAMN05444167_2704 [Terriglobus roseus]|uniref:Uncharacterized protein n=1 Tax=Terriglobus roseus TaxID=392734 RepID=A0A1G7M556_9BACT|nr:hypothetical protein SAMN05444167_2704 [Terriglobus roseus]
MNFNFCFRDYALPLALILAALMLLTWPSHDTPHQHAHSVCTMDLGSPLPL